MEENYNKNKEDFLFFFLLLTMKKYLLELSLLNRVLIRPYSGHNI